MQRQQLKSLSAFEQELLQRIRQMSEPQKQRVLQFVHQVESEESQSSADVGLQSIPDALKAIRHYSGRELMKLSYEERQQILLAELELAANEDFELFEAFGEDDLLDDE